MNVVLTHNAHFAEANDVVARVEAQGSRAIALPFSAGETDTFDGFVSAFQAAGKLGPIGFITRSIMPAMPAAWVSERYRSGARCALSHPCEGVFLSQNYCRCWPMAGEL